MGFSKSIFLQQIIFWPNSDTIDKKIIINNRSGDYLIDILVMYILRIQIVKAALSYMLVEL